MRMAERIPHFTALRAFEAAARYLSFQEAAAELGLSPSAVSHQIRTLEAYLDTKLFTRLTRAIELTEAGETLRPGVEEGFRRIEHAVKQVRSIKTHSVLVISTGPSVAAKWIVPRLYHFEERFPAIEVRITTTSRAINLHKEDVDIAIRHGHGKYDGLDSIRLFGEAYTPMCAPDLMQRKSATLKHPENLTSHRLLHDHGTLFPEQNVPDWSRWFKNANILIDDSSQGQHFQQSDHAIQAALDGAGVLLGRIAIAAPDLAAGRLVRPFELTLPSPYGYYFVTRKGRCREKPVAAFLAWLQEEAENFAFLPP
ncbi:MAG: transcriptional regulator GcvA [Pseudomonadota bacterium]